MRQYALLALTLVSFTTPLGAQDVPPAGSRLGSVTGGDFQEAHLLIENKCTPCHSTGRIEEALSAGKEMQSIQHRMEQKGVSLKADEQMVLGIFWKQTPLKKR